jgi:parallel beta-helix repeat protein
MSERKLDRKAISALMLALLLVGLLTMAFNIQPARAEATVNIRPDGSIYPLTAPISTLDNVTYTFVDNLYDWRLVVERDNIVIDGAGYTLQGTGSVGVYLSGRTNVTVWNTQIKNFEYGMMLASSSSNSIIDNNIADNWRQGIYLISHSSNNRISGNNITANDVYGVWLQSSSNNSVSGNTITNNDGGIWFGYSSNYNNVSGNTITANNGYGIRLERSCNYNSVTGNNITNNGGGIVLYSALIIEHSSNYNIVSGNNITNNRKSGIWFDSFCNYNNVSGNNIRANGYGIWLEGPVRYNSVSGNNITNNGGGIVLYSVSLGTTSRYNSLSGNTIANNWDGIWLRCSSNNSVSGNTITNNNGGIVLAFSSNYNNVSGNTFTNDGLDVQSYYPNSVWNNTVNGKPLVYLDGIANYGVGNAGQVILVRCDNIRVENLNLSRTCIGVQLLTTNNTIISGNTITANRRYGVWFGSSSNNSISENNITNNGCGIALSSSFNNIIYHNNFIDNIQQFSVNPSGYSNVWDDGYPSGGNYWSDYTERYPDASEFDASGIWNKPYVLDGSNQDSYPLIHTYVIPEFPLAIVLLLFMVLSILSILSVRRKILKNRRKGGCAGDFSIIQ